MQQVTSGVITEYFPFDAYDPFGEEIVSGLSGFTVYRIRNGAAAVLMSSPTIVEQRPGLYGLLLNSDMGINTGYDEETVAVEISHDEMQTFHGAYMIVRPKITAGYTLGVSSGGAWNVDSPAKIAGITGIITTLDSLDANQDAQHGVTRSYLADPAPEVIAYPTSFDDVSVIESGTLSTLQYHDSTYHTLRPISAYLECVYEFQLGLVKTFVSMEMYCKLVSEGGGSPSSVTVYGYDYILATYAAIGNISSSTLAIAPLTLDSTMISATGQVLIKIEEGTGTNYRIDIDYFDIHFIKSVAQLVTELSTQADQITTDISNVADDVITIDGKVDTLSETVTNGATLTVMSGSTTTSLIVTAPTNITSAHLSNAVIVTNTTGRTKAIVRVTGVAGSSPVFTLTLATALPSTPQVDDTFILGPQYINTGSL